MIISYDGIAAALNISDYKAQFLVAGFMLRADPRVPLTPADIECLAVMYALAFGTGQANTWRNYTDVVTRAHAYLWPPESK